MAQHGAAAQGCHGKAKFISQFQTVCVDFQKDLHSLPALAASRISCLNHAILSRVWRLENLGACQKWVFILWVTGAGAQIRLPER